jgi:energy-coupling factor transport system permease protein
MTSTPSTRHAWHAATWLLWACAAATAVQLAPSPVYVVLVIGLAALVVELHAADSPYARAFPVLVAVGVVFALIRIVLAVATTHGIGDVLFTTPALTLPKLLGGFTAGGTVETPVVLQAAAQGLAIVGIMAVFGAFNGVASHYELVQTAPRAFHELGLVVTVALAFVPSTVLAVREVREADRARTGRRPSRRGGGLVRLVVPVLESGLERAVRLAESMESRGFARAESSRADRAAAWLGLLALLALAGAFVALIGQAPVAAAIAGLVGCGAIVGAIGLASAGTRRVRYRPRRMTARDWVVAGMSLVAPVALGVLSLAGDSSLSWSVSPLQWPSFHLLPFFALLPLAAPLAVSPSRRMDRRFGATPSLTRVDA